MRFTSLSFFVFFAAVYIIFWLLKGRQKIIFLLPASFAFYAAWSPVFALHFFIFVIINYILVRMLLIKKRSSVLWFGVVINSVNLFFFKYFYMFLIFLYDVSGLSIFKAAEFNSFLEQSTGIPSIILPLAISFYTFQMLAFLIDTWRDQVTEDPGFIDYSVFILFFPQLVAGPIMRHSDFFGQLTDIKPKPELIRYGIFLMILGLIKKVLIADNLAAPVNTIFLNPEKYDSVTVALGAAGYAARVYGDFAGYTDLARGASFLLGIHLPPNFSGPFLSKSLQEMWRRWHITLSTWLRDYLYIPMGGSRSGPARRNINLIITFTLGGLWHGANYTYIVWGFFHGVMLVIEGYVKSLTFTLFFNKNSKSGKMPDSLGQTLSGKPVLNRKIVSALAGFALSTAAVIYAFSFFSIGVIFFNSPNMPHALTMLRILFSGIIDPARQSPFIEQIIYALVIVFLLNAAEYKERKLNMPNYLKDILLSVFAIISLILLTKFSPQGADFIYFQF
jgi:alginate O-acetyltransferase complex protein AlgI